MLKFLLLWRFQLLKSQFIEDIIILPNNVYFDFLLNSFFEIPNKEADIKAELSWEEYFCYLFIPLFIIQEYHLDYLDQLTNRNRSYKIYLNHQLNSSDVNTLKILVYRHSIYYIFIWKNTLLENHLLVHNVNGIKFYWEPKND